MKKKEKVKNREKRIYVEEEERRRIEQEAKRGHLEGGLTDEADVLV